MEPVAGRAERDNPPLAKWQQFEQEAPDMALTGKGLWEQHVLAYLATVRADGSPRVHPVIPVLADGSVFVAIAEASPKWRDVRRDPRCVLHSLPGQRDDEFVLRCRAREAAGSRDVVRQSAHHVIHDDDHIVEFEIEHADLGHWEQVGTPTTYAVRHRWKPAGIRDVGAR
jgi:hypothetical protein